jgi:hypothetical protein
MCQRVTCPTCGKPGFVGCGRHVEQVLADVPADQRCKCREQRSAGASSATGSESIWKRLFG